MKLPVIHGREVVPVRLIPLITYDELGPVSLTGILANRLNIGGWNYSEDFDEVEINEFNEETGLTERTTKSRCELTGPEWRNNRIFAYHLHNGKTPTKMSAPEWDDIYHEIKQIESLLRKTKESKGLEPSQKPIWRLKTTIALPPGVFLWREDLDEFWSRYTNYYGEAPGEPEYFRKPVNYEAYIRPDYQMLILEGFEHLKNHTSDRPQTNAPIPPGQFQSIQIGYSDFVTLCRVDDPTTWARWLSIRPEGIWISPPPETTDLSAAERAAWCEHPEKNLTKPALKFPCSLRELQSFLEYAGVYGCIDPFDMAGFVLMATESLKTASSDSKPLKPCKPNLKEQESLLKMVITMAVKGYSYNPQQKKSTATQEIADDAASVGLTIDPDTVRKWLQQGAAILPRPENGG